MIYEPFPHFGIIYEIVKSAHKGIIHVVNKSAKSVRSNVYPLRHH